MTEQGLLFIGTLSLIIIHAAQAVSIAVAARMWSMKLLKLGVDLTEIC